MKLGPRVLWLGQGAARTLAAGGEGEVAIVGDGFCYLAFPDGRWVHVAGTRAVRAPLTVAVAGYEAPEVGEVVMVSAAEITIGGRAVALDQASADPAPHRAPLGEEARESAKRVALLPPPEETLPGLALLRRGLVDEATIALAGRGPGLTPAGDDVLAGWAAWQWHDGAPPADLAARCEPLTSSLSLAYLGCAARGELPEPVDRFLRTLRSGAVPAPPTAWGDSSGLAAAHGVLAAVTRG